MPVGRRESSSSSEAIWIGRFSELPRVSYEDGLWRAQLAARVELSTRRALHTLKARRLLSWFEAIVDDDQVLYGEGVSVADRHHRPGELQVAVLG